ncbi:MULTISPECIES: LytR/AlgR family response regulator transcription factor [Giesbergeria]|uniref:LytR/AlgR family response regulator transcription factor n=1 Tax=Giesbergeria sinuosa TaxID=80883 RepID=A0ABV9QAI6_9BURK
MNILIVDDEPLARSRLHTLLADTGSHQLAQAATAHEALALLSAAGSGQPFDLLLLDIHLPGQDGLQLARQLHTLAHAPAVVFVTAHTEHALNAFELDAVDYLTKPVRRERLQQALAKVGRVLAAPPAVGLEPAVGEVLLIQDRGRTERVPLAEVLYCKAELKYVTVCTATHSYVLDGALSELESRYGAHWVRIHRNALVARHAIRALEKHRDSQDGEVWAVRLHGLAQWLTVSRRQVPVVREALMA